MQYRDGDTMKKKLTLIMPAKNAVSHLRNTLSSVGKQTLKQSITIRMLLGESADNTGAEFEKICREHGIDYIVHEERTSFYETMWKAFSSVDTDYFGFMCFSDGYLCNRYLENAVLALDSDSSASFVHADLHTLLLNGKYTTALPLRNIIRPVSGSAFTANICCLNDGINELTFVGRSAQAKELLDIAYFSEKMFTNVFGALFTMYLVFGCSGIFVPRFCVFGRHHSGSRNFNMAIIRHDSQWTAPYDQIRRKVQNEIILNNYRWRDGALNELSTYESLRSTHDYLYQLEYTRSVCQNV